jgi:uncharacterized integral membrane protein
LGLSVAAVSVVSLSLWALGAHRLTEIDPERGLQTLSLGVATGVALTTANLHLYDKRIRWIISSSGILGLWFLATLLALPEGVAEHLLFNAGLGFLFVALSAYALKEQFCFRIPGLKLVPLFLASAMLAALAGQLLAFGVTLLPAAVLLTVLCVAKWRMPLGHDVGDKSHYQV